MAQTKCFDCMKWIYRSGPEAPLCSACKRARILRNQAEEKEDSDE